MSPKWFPFLMIFFVATGSLAKSLDSENEIQQLIRQSKCSFSKKSGKSSFKFTCRCKGSKPFNNKNRFSLIVSNEKRKYKKCVQKGLLKLATHQCRPTSKFLELLELFEDRCKSCNSMFRARKFKYFCESVSKHSPTASPSSSPSISSSYQSCVKVPMLNFNSLSVKCQCPKEEDSRTSYYYRFESKLELCLNSCLGDPKMPCSPNTAVQAQTEVDNCCTKCGGFLQFLMSSNCGLSGPGCYTHPEYCSPTASPTLTVTPTASPTISPSISASPLICVKQPQFGSTTFSVKCQCPNEEDSISSDSYYFQSSLESCLNSCLGDPKTPCNPNTAFYAQTEVDNCCTQCGGYLQFLSSSNCGRSGQGCYSNPEFCSPTPSPTLSKTPSVSPTTSSVM